MQNTSYRPEIDGLRALAILGVILFHIHPSWLQGGFVGVDVFFVISGFLITGILERELSDRRFSFFAFYARRIRRIFPLLLAVVAATIIAQYSIGYRLDCSMVGKQALATLGSISNIFFWFQSADYWGVEVESSPLLHTWSLAIEEQFYLVLPFILNLLRTRTRLYRVLVLALTTLLSLVALWWASRQSSVAAFYLLPTRWWELSAGSLLALLTLDRPPQPKYRVWVGGFALVGLAIIVCSACFMRRFDLSMVWPVVGTALVLSCGHVGACNWLLTRPFLVHLGRLSYSLYLWHWPFLVFAEPYLNDLPKEWLIFPIYLCAWMSFYGIEQTTRWRKGIIPHIVVASGVLGFAAVLLMLSDRGYDLSGFCKPTTSTLSFDLNPKRIASFNPNGKWTSYSGFAAPSPLASLTAYREDGIVLGDESKAIQVMVIGDSHGLMWSPTIRAIIERHHLRASFCSMGGVALPWNLGLTSEQTSRHLSAQMQQEFDRSRLENIARWRPDVLILCTPWDLQEEQKVQGFIAYCQEYSRRVLLIEQPPRLAQIGNRSALQYACFRGVVPKEDHKQYWPILHADTWQQGRTLLHNLAARFPSCRVVPTADFYENDGKGLLLDGLEIIYRDDHHLSDWGAQLAESRLEYFILEGLAELPQESSAAIKVILDNGPLVSPPENRDAAVLNE